MSVSERLLRRRLITASGCWEWQGATIKGYGYMKDEEKVARVHRIAYELFVGPIGAGLEVDHLCDRRGCFNPEHLELVTRDEHMRRQKTRAYQKDNSYERGVYCNLPADLHAALRGLAAENSRSLSAEIRQALRFYVNAQRNGKAA